MGERRGERGLEMYKFYIAGAFSVLLFIAWVFLVLYGTIWALGILLRCFWTVPAILLIVMVLIGRKIKQETGPYEEGNQVKKTGSISLETVILIGIALVILIIYFSFA